MAYNSLLTCQHCGLGDKTIFEWLGLGRDRNTIDDRRLILGIPQMFEVIRQQIGQDEQLFQKYKSDIGKLAMLMSHKGTALKRMVDWSIFSAFEFVEHDQKQLAAALYQWFQEQYPQKLPVCSHCAASSDQAKVSHHHLVLDSYSAIVVPCWRFIQCGPRAYQLAHH